MNAIAHASPAPLRGPKLDNRRVLAGVVDLVIVALGAAVVLLAGDALSGNEMKGALGAVILGWSLYYFFALESGDGQTVGKKLMKLRVVREDGSSAGMREIAVRTVLRVIDNYLVGLIVMLATGERRQRIGDLAAGTVVVDASGPAPAAARPAAAVAVADAVENEAPAGEVVEDELVADEVVEDEVVEDEVVEEEHAEYGASSATITLPSRPEPPAPFADPGATNVADEGGGDNLPEITSPSIEGLARDVQAAQSEPVEVEAEREPVEAEPEPVEVTVEPFEHEPEPVEVTVEHFEHEDEPEVEDEPVGFEPVQTVVHEPVSVEPVEAPEVEQVSVEPVEVPEAVEPDGAGDESVNVRSVETVSAIDLIMGGAAEPSGSDEPGEDEGPATA